MPPVVSICVPTYNGAAYLPAALDSILAQTFTNFEVLIVDDCSSDDTVKIAERYALQDARVRISLNASNLGLVGNWNRCVELVAGEWIKFVFQDDTIAPRCLEKLIAATESGHQIVACARSFIFEAGTQESLRNYLEWHRVLLASLYAKNNTLNAIQFSRATLDHVGTNLVGEPTVVLLHKSLFSEFGYFNTFMVQAVDSEYWTRIATVHGIAFVNEELAEFRVHPASTSSIATTFRRSRTQLDELITRHDLAFAPAYENIRLIASRERPDINLERDFWNAVHRVMIGANAARVLQTSTGRNAAEVERVFRAYPRLLQLPFSYKVRPFLARIRNAIRARLRRSQP